jgi:hypothetical protein
LPAKYEYHYLFKSLGKTIADFTAIWIIMANLITQIFSYYLDAEKIVLEKT